VTDINNSPLSRSFLNVLKKLSERPGDYHAAAMIPNGHGHTIPRGARATTLSHMRRFGLVEYGKKTTASLYGWKITEHGISVLQNDRR
jgi:hypothetical protein